MFSHLLKFEFNYFRKQPSFIVVSLIFFLLPFFAMITDQVQIGGGTGNVNVNSPFAITNTMLIMNIFGMFLVANFVGGTATRDFTHKMDGLMLSTPMDKFSYLWGRLTGSLLFCLLAFLTVPLATLIGTFWYSVDPERLGDTQLWPYIWTYLVFIVPNFIFCSVLFYAFALVARSMMGMYLGVIGFFILNAVAGRFMDEPDQITLAALLDPFGGSALSEQVKYWTPLEKNTQIFSLDSLLLQNRVLWLTVSFLIALLTHYTISVRKGRDVRTVTMDIEEEESVTQKIAIVVTPQDGGSVSWQRFITRTLFEVRQIIKSAPFIILCLFTAFMMLTVFIDGGQKFYGTMNWPLTRNMATFIQGNFSILMLIIVTYYAGESVWRERTIGMGDIVESSPIANWTLYFPKVIALTAVMMVLLCVGIAVTVLYQLTRNYVHIEPGVYASNLFVVYLVPMMMMCVLSIFIQVLSPNKYIGMLIFVSYFIVSAVLSNLGLEHGMWHFSEAPSTPYSDINQFGHFTTAALWYNMYWGGLSLIFVIVGFGLWRRGVETTLSYRFSQMKNNIGTAGYVSMALALTLFLGSGGYIFYNTRVVNDFVGRDESLDLRAQYEKDYKQYNDLPVPSITDVYVEADIFPYQRKMVAKGHYQLKNETSQTIEKVLVTLGPRNTMTIDMDGAQLTDFNEDFNQWWLTFDKPLQPQETRQFNFNVIRENKGFEDGGSDTNLVANGTFINNKALLPVFGYNKNYELNDRHERRKRDLPPPERMSKLEDQSQYGFNFLGKDADFINYEAIVSTSADQIAITPGYLQKEWQEGARRYFHYKMDAPIFNFFAFQSGRYDVQREDYKGIKIEIYHHEDHKMNVERMIESVKDSLDYFGREFSPYQHRQVRIIEFPRYAAFAQSFSNTVPYSEDIGFVADLRDPKSLDYVYFVTAHEMAHQWWGHQITPAWVQGAAVLSETLSEYSAYMVLENKYGPDHLRKFLKYEMDDYLRGRTRETIEEMPLMRVENQNYIHYKKGGVVMYSIRDRIGEEALNKALQKFLMAHQYAADPYPTTLDLISYIKAEADEQDHHFIDDMFERITLFDLKVESAESSETEDGKYQLTLELDAKKFYVSGKGEEEETPLDNTFDIGVFTEDPDLPGVKDHILHFEKHRIVTGKNTITLTLDKEPKFAGVDPYIKMVDRNSDDNLKPVQSK